MSLEDDFMVKFVKGLVLFIQNNPITTVFAIAIFVVVVYVIREYLRGY